MVRDFFVRVPPDRSGGRLGGVPPWAAIAGSTQRPSGRARLPVVSATFRPPGDSLVAPGIDELRPPPDFVTPASSAGSRPRRSLPCVRPRDSAPFPLPVEGTRDAGGSGVFPLHSHISPPEKSRLVPVHNPSRRPGRIRLATGVPPACLLPSLKGPRHTLGGRSGDQKLKAIFQ